MSPSGQPILKCFDWQAADPLFTSPASAPKDHPMVKVIVSKNGQEQEFLIHKEMVTVHKPKFFTTILGPVGESDIFKIEEDPEVFFGLLQYAYRGRFWHPSTVNDIKNLWNIYIYAEKKDMKYLQDIMMNRITAFYYRTKTFPSMDTIVYVYGQTQAESAINPPSMARRFLSRCHLSISINCTFGVKYVESTERIAEVLLKTEGLLFDTLAATRKPEGIPWKVDLDPRKAKSCDYHQHKWNEKCPNIKETPFDSETDN